MALTWSALVFQADPLIKFEDFSSTAMNETKEVGTVHLIGNQRTAAGKSASTVVHSQPSAASPFGGKFPVISTERLILREIKAEDAKDILAIHGDPSVMKWFGSDVLPDAVAANRLIEFFASCRKSATGIRWGIERKEDGKFLGTCGFYSWDRNYQRCNIGYELGAFAWGKGYMQEAVSKIIPWGFSNMMLHRIEAHIHPENSASIKLAKSFGFVEEGLLRELQFWGGRYQDMLLLSLLQNGQKGGSIGGNPGKSISWWNEMVSCIDKFLGRKG